MSTSGVDLNDPGISKACNDMMADMLRWVLLGYTNTNKTNQLNLFACGTGDVDEMKEYVKADDICYGVFTEPSREKRLKLTVTYIPDIIGGVWRARALVHGKAVANKFGSEKMIRVSDINHFNVQRFRSGLELPPRVTDYVPSPRNLALPNPFSPPLSPVKSPPPRGDSLKPCQLAVSRKPISSNKTYPRYDTQTPTDDTSKLDSVQPSAGLPLASHNATQVSLFSVATGTAAVENFRLRSESPSLSPAVKLSNRSLSIPSPPEDSDGDDDDGVGDDDDDGSDHPAASSRSSRHAHAAQSPRQEFYPGPFQPSDSSSEDEESREVPLYESEALDDNDIEDIPDSHSTSEAPFAMTKPSSPPKLSLLSRDASRDKPLPPVRFSSVDLLEALNKNVSPASSVEELPVTAQPVDKTPTCNTFVGPTLSSLPSPPSSPDNIKPSLATPTFRPLPKITVPSNLQPVTRSQPTPLPPQPQPQPPCHTQAQLQSEKSQPSTPQTIPQLPRPIPSQSQSPSQPQPQPQLEPRPRPRPQAQLRPNSPAQPLASLPKSPGSPPPPLYNTFRKDSNAMNYSHLHRRVSTAIDEAEEQKLAVLVEERRRRTILRAERERAEKREQEARDREFMQRREQVKLKRLQKAKMAEMTREEMKRKQEYEEAVRQAQMERRYEEQLSRQTRVQEKIRNLGGMLLLAGFVSVLSGPTWKRRYYQLTTEEWKFFKDDEDMNHPLNVLDLSRIKAIREWDEGYEELEFMPNGFAVELKDGPPWLFLAESKEEKETFSGLLNQAGNK